MQPPIPKDWIARLLAAARPAPQADTVVPDSCGEADGWPTVCEVEVHALDASGYGMFRHQGYWLVSWAGSWFKAPSLEGCFTPVASRMVPIAVVAMVAETSARAACTDS
jgi:hypothetical protein